jgi:hypothetical protein
MAAEEPRSAPFSAERFFRPFEQFLAFFPNNKISEQQNKKEQLIYDSVAHTTAAKIYLKKELDAVVFPLDGEKNTAGIGSEGFSGSKSPRLDFLFVCPGRLCTAASFELLCGRIKTEDRQFRGAAETNACFHFFFQAKEIIAERLFIIFVTGCPEHRVRYRINQPEFESGSGERVCTEL